MLKDNALFVQEFFRTFHSTGSLCPTTRWAAKAMVAPLTEKKDLKPFNILELGPGTGSVTKYILRSMGFEDRLTICEINERFMGALKRNLKNNPYFETHKSRITFHCCPMQELPEDQKYDLIICAIPFLNFSPPLVRELFTKIGILSTNEAVMTYYEYLGLRPFGKAVSNSSNSQRLRELDKFLVSLHSSHLDSSSKVWLNFTPIKVYRLNKLQKLSDLIST